MSNIMICKTAVCEANIRQILSFLCNAALSKLVIRIWKSVLH